jgi:hypothetical protein
MTNPTPIAPEARSERRRIGGLIIGSAVLSAIGVGALAYTATNAAFTGTTSTSGNSFTSATVSLTDDDFGVGNFVAADMMPGDSKSDCIEVKYTGSTATGLAAMKVYGTPTGLLADNLTLSIGYGAAGSTCAAPGALTNIYNSGFDTFPTTYATGLAGRVPTATNQTVAYVFNVTLKAATTNASQGESATATFTWEVSSS